MSETQEGLQLGNLLRHPDGTGVTIEYSDSKVEMDRRRGERRASRKSFFPRFSQPPTPGTLIEIPYGGGEYFITCKADRGQEKPGSVYGERISRAQFQKLKGKPGVKTVRPDNI